MLNWLNWLIVSARLRGFWVACCPQNVRGIWFTCVQRQLDASGKRFSVAGDDFEVGLLRILWTRHHGNHGNHWITPISGRAFQFCGFSSSQALDKPEQEETRRVLSDRVAQSFEQLKLCSISAKFAKKRRFLMVFDGERCISSLGGWLVDFLCFSSCAMACRPRRRETLLDPGYVQELQQEVDSWWIHQVKPQLSFSSNP